MNLADGYLVKKDISIKGLLKAITTARHLHISIPGSFRLLAGKRSLAEGINS
jgi:hypothetical protein